MTPLICPFMSGRMTIETLVGERDQVFEAPCIGERCALWVVSDGSETRGSPCPGSCGVLAGSTPR